VTPSIRRRRFFDTVARRLGLRSNSLRRRSDRIESYILMTLVLAFLIGAPLLALLTGRSSYESGLRAEQPPAVQHRVTAQLTSDALNEAQATEHVASSQAKAAARWTYEGENHQGGIPVPAGAKAGSTTTVTVDDSGRLLGNPQTRLETVTHAAVTGALAALGLGLVLLLVRLTVRRVLIRRRLGDWDAAWAAFEPKWTRRPGA
jgi:hypothetical protein